MKIKMNPNFFNKGASFLLQSKLKKSKKIPMTLQLSIDSSGKEGELRR